jgi:hypothetical protein
VSVSSSLASTTLSELVDMSDWDESKGGSGSGLEITSKRFGLASCSSVGGPPCILEPHHVPARVYRSPEDIHHIGPPRHTLRD